MIIRYKSLPRGQKFGRYVFRQMRVTMKETSASLRTAQKLAMSVENTTDLQRDQTYFRNNLNWLIIPGDTWYVPTVALWLKMPQEPTCARPSATTTVNRLWLWCHTFHVITHRCLVASIKLTMFKGWSGSATRFFVIIRRLIAGRHVLLVAMQFPLSIPGHEDHGCKRSNRNFIGDAIYIKLNGRATALNYSCRVC